MQCLFRPKSEPTLTPRPYHIMNLPWLRYSSCAYILCGFPLSTLNIFAFINAKLHLPSIYLSIRSCYPNLPAKWWQYFSSILCTLAFSQEPLMWYLTKCFTKIHLYYVIAFTIIYLLINFTIGTRQVCMTWHFLRKAMLNVIYRVVLL